MPLPFIPRDPLPRRRSRQRGSAAVFAAIASLAGLVAMALAIDIGRLYFVQRNLQRMANMAALDSARIAGGCLGVPRNATQAAFAEAIDSVQRNGGQAGDIGSGGVEVGRMLKTGGVRSFDPMEERKNRAVQVTLQTLAPRQLLPLFGTTQRTLHASAAAYSRPAATVTVGSKAAQITPDVLNRLLGKMLGGDISLDAVTYRNLFGATVPLKGLLARLEIGSPEDLLSASVPAPSLLDALAALLAEQGDAAAATAATGLARATGDDRVVAVRDAIGVDDGVDPSQGAVVSVGDLITSVAQIANGTNLLNVIIPGPPSSPDAVLDARVIEAARQAVLTPGDSPSSYARNAQVLLATALPIRIGDARGNLKLFVQAAQATAQVEEILCGRRGHEHDTVVVGARSSVVRLGIGEFDDINAPDPQPQPTTLLELAPIAIGGQSVSGVRITGFAYADPITDPQNIQLPPFVGPFPAGGITQTLGTPPASSLEAQLADLASKIELKIELPPGLPAITSAAVLARVQPLIDDRLRPLLLDLLTHREADLLQSLSIAFHADIAGADVTVLKVVAEEPYLFTR